MIRGSADDKYLNSEMNLFLADPAAYPLLAGEMIKRIGDGTGAVVKEVYKIAGGIVQKIPTVKENVEGDTEQASTIYTIHCANTDRSIT